MSSPEVKQLSVEIGAYFYPLTSWPDGYGTHRAHQVGEGLGMNELWVPPDEFEVIKDAPSLFKDHDQPRTYSLGGATKWDDADASSLGSQIGIAQEYGLSYFIFDSYNGLRDGMPFSERAIPARRLREVAGRMGLLGFKYAKMEVLEGPRMVMPIPPADKGLGNGFGEPGRAYDLTPGTARYIVDCNVGDWECRDYLKRDAQPYQSFLMPASLTYLPNNEAAQKLKDFVNAFRDYAFEEYCAVPYVVGVQRNIGTRDIDLWAAAGADTVTQYCGLCDFGPGAADIQQYGELIGRRFDDWSVLGKAALAKQISFVPTPAIGWDASPRGERGHSLEQVRGRQPYSPIVTGSTGELFEQMLRNAIAYTVAHVPDGERFVTIFAWNEIGEGAALLYRLLRDGKIDKSFLEAVKRVKESLPAL